MACIECVHLKQVRKYSLILGEPKVECLHDESCGTELYVGLRVGKFIEPSIGARPNLLMAQREQIT